MYTSTIKVSKDIDAIEKLFAPEDRKLNRSTYTIKKTGKELTFDIKADDAVALKTAFNTITKILIVFERTGELQNG